jgi:tetrahydromethanopterin S-methyltransferase subunit E
MRRIYANHWLARRLADSGDILSSVAPLSAAFDSEQLRVDARVKRLTRSRNAAIHGGPLSDAACGTIAEFATALAQQALNTTIWAIVTGQQVDTYAMSRRDEYRQRILNLKQGGDLANLFRLTP